MYLIFNVVTAFLVLNDCVNVLNGTTTMLGVLVVLVNATEGPAVVEMIADIEVVLELAEVLVIEIVLVEGVLEVLEVALEERLEGTLEGMLEGLVEGLLEEMLLVEETLGEMLEEVFMPVVDTVLADRIVLLVDGKATNVVLIIGV